MFKRIAKIAGMALATPIALFLCVAVLLYLPPVQRWAVGLTTQKLSEATGMTIRIGQVRLAFPLSLSLGQMLAAQGEGTSPRDTLVCARALRIDVRLWPLLQGRAEVTGLGLYDAKLNTRDMISDTRIEGRVGELSGQAACIEWGHQLVQLDHACLRNADLKVYLSDTAKKDTTPSTSAWKIGIGKVDILNTSLYLRMPGDSMRIGADIGQMALRHGWFDTGAGFYSVHSLKIWQADATYDIPQAARMKSGIDYNHLAFKNLRIQADTFSYDSAGRMRVFIPQLKLKEKSGLQLTHTRLQVLMDSTSLCIPTFILTTPWSAIKGNATMEFKALSPGRGGKLEAILQASLGHRDIQQLVMPMLPQDIRNLMPATSLQANIRLQGNVDRMQLLSCRLQLPGMLTLNASGYMIKPLSPNRMQARVKLDLKLQRTDWTNRMLQQLGAGSVRFPAGLNLQAQVSANRQLYGADAALTVPGKGSIKLKGNLNAATQQYQIRLLSSRFPLRAFLPDLPLSPLTAQLTANGTGFDIMSPHSRLNASAHIGSLTYDTLTIDSIKVQVQMAKGKGSTIYHVNSKWLNSRGLLTTQQVGKMWHLTLQSDWPEIRLKDLGITEDTLDVGAYIRLDGYTNQQFTDYGITGNINNIHISTKEMGTSMKDVQFALSTSPDTSRVWISSGDFNMNLQAQGNFEKISSHLQHFAETLQLQLKERRLDYSQLKVILPTANFYLNAGRDNPLSNMARIKGYDFNDLSINLKSDTAQGIVGHAEIHTVKAAGWQLDTISLRMFQDDRGFKMLGNVINSAKENPDKFRLGMDAYVYPRDVGAHFNFIDKDGDKGVDLGVRAQVIPDKGLRLSLAPGKSIIAYRTFNINDNNYLFLGNDKKVYADINLEADDGTGLKLYGEPNDSINDLTLSLVHINLDELSKSIPYMPQISGMLEADVHVKSVGKELTAMGSVQTTQLAYEGVPLGDIGTDIVYLPEGDKHQASMLVTRNGKNALLAEGIYSEDNGGIFDGTAQLTNFPLDLINGFMAGTDVMLRGMGNGMINVQGSLSQPKLNGSLMLNDAHVYSDVYGFDFRLDNDSLRFRNNQLDFEQFRMYSTGKNPLILDGNINLGDFSNIAMNLNMTGKQFEVINTKKKKSSMLYGQVIADFEGSMRGNMNNLRLNGKLNVLGGTDMTYILKDSPLSVDDRLKGLVEFVDFNDSTATTTDSQTPPTSVDISLSVNINETAHFHCDLSDDKQSYVDMEGGGNLNLRMRPQGDLRLTGQMTVQNGEMKYALPIIPLKTFTISPGSSVTFTGDVANPTLNITAKERVKAIVTENDVPRSVAFDVGVSITKPLEQMGLTFIVEAPEDLSVQNQLAAMTQEQRSKTAVTLLATGMYMTDEGLNTSGFKANNALNAFLQNEIQNITDGALSTFDINVGVESGTSATGTATTDYSFQFAKRFWGNRVSIIIGGKVSAGADAHNSAESFIDNVSLEYRLDKGSTRYVKVYYDRSANDPLEGQLTKTGAGLVLRRKTNRLGELFLFRTPKPQPTVSTKE